MIKCGKMVKYGVMAEFRPCIRKTGHSGLHSPDLIGAMFGGLLVISKGIIYMTIDERRK